MVSRGVYRRTAVYLQDRSREPKYLFVRPCDVLEAHRAPSSILDVGAASGDFLSYAAGRFESANLVGIDRGEALVQAARAKLPAARFECDDAEQMTTVADSAFDAVLMTGVHSIFDDFRPSFSECLRAVAADGIVLVTGIFNSYPVDALIKWRYSGEDGSYQPGFNLFSVESVGAYLRKRRDIARFSFEQFRLPFSLPRQEDPIRSWTEPGDDQTGLPLRNGIMPLDFQIYILSIIKNG